MSAGAGVLDLDPAIDDLADAVRAARSVVPVGGRTHWEIGGAPLGETEVRAPVGIVDHQPAELIVTVGAGTTVGDLDAELASAGQHCPLDPRDRTATVGGVLATGLSGIRRLGHRPLRDRVLEVHLVTGEGRRVKGGARVVKSVTGYDVCRLAVGSFGTLGVIVQVTLRCEPLPGASAWFDCPYPGEEALVRAYRPVAVLGDRERCRVLVEGTEGDVEDQARRLGVDPGAVAPVLPEGPHRGRISVDPRLLGACGAELDAAGVRWLAEAGVGTVHVATDEAGALGAARDAAARHGGWLLREAGAPDLDPFGVELPVGDLQRRIAAALDPGGTCNPGRLPIGRLG